MRNLHLHILFLNNDKRQTLYEEFRVNHGITAPHNSVITVHIIESSMKFVGMIIPIDSTKVHIQ